MEPLSAFQLAFSAAVVTGAFAVRGGTGFGASTVAIPLLAFSMPLAIAVPVVSVLIVWNSLALIARDWRHIAWRAVLSTVPFTLVGVLAGLYFLTRMEERDLLRMLGVVVALYGLYGLLGADRAPAPPLRLRPMLAATTGIAGGSLGALFGAGVGPIYAMYLGVLKLDNTVFRVSVTSVIFFQLIIRVGGYAGLGYYRGTVLVVLAAAVPFMLLGTWLGDSVVRRLDQRRFGHLVSAVLLVSGACLIAR